MKNVLLLVFLAAAIAFSACRSTHFSAENMPRRQLLFGNGGGFTGKTTSIVLLENGQAFQKDFLELKYVELKRLKKRTAKAFFAAAEDLDLSKMKFNHPGNLSQFLEFQTDSTTARVTWGDANFPVNQKVKDLYIALGAAVKTDATH